MKMKIMALKANNPQYMHMQSAAGSQHTLLFSTQHVGVTRLYPVPQGDTWCSETDLGGVDVCTEDV